MCLVVSSWSAICCSKLALQVLLQVLQLPSETTRSDPLKAGKTCSSDRFSVARQKMQGMHQFSHQEGVFPSVSKSRLDTIEARSDSRGRCVSICNDKTAL